MKKIILGFLCTLLLSVTVSAASAILKAQGADSLANTAISFANVSFVNKTNQSFIAGSITDEQRMFKISKPPIASYTVHSNSTDKLYAQSAITSDPIKVKEIVSLNNVEKKFFLKIAIPASLITYGALAKFDRSSESIDNEVRDAVYKNINRRFTIDDYAQYVPAFSAFTLDFLGLEAKHDLIDRNITMATSMALMGTIVYATKSITKIQRPDGTSFNSFPSGHAATAFVGAHILFKEYNHISPWIGVTGYTIAAGTGAFRVINNRHWVSDILTGAGVGILTVEMTYLLLPKIRQLFQKGNMDKLSVRPFAGSGTYGMTLSYKL